MTKIQFYKYEQIVVKFMCEFFGCDYCVLLTINMLCHVEVMFIQILCIKLVKYWDKYTEMHGQQNVKKEIIDSSETLD